MTTRLRFRRPLIRLALSWGLLAAPCLACTVEEGERASTGSCPEGEICSDDTPTGLDFYGPPPTDEVTDFLPQLAAGGSLNLHWDAAGEDSPRPVGAIAESSAPWFLEVEPADPDRDAYALWRGADDVRLTAAGEGEAFVRVVNPDTDELYDRILITTERIATIEVVDVNGVPVTELAPGASTTLVFRLVGGSDKRLIDEAMTISSETELERASWDCVDLVVPTEGQAVRFSLEAGHRRWGLEIPIAD